MDTTTTTPIDTTTTLENKLNDLDIKEENKSVDVDENNTDGTTTTTKLSKGQKKRLKEKEKKLKLKENGGENATTTTTQSKKEPKVEETPEEKFNRQIEWGIYQLRLGQQRRDTSREQFKESESIINKLLSDKIVDAKKAQLMVSCFGKNIEKVMKQHPMPKQTVKKVVAPPTTTTPTTATTTTTTTTTSTATSIEKPTVEAANN